MKASGLYREIAEIEEKGKSVAVCIVVKTRGATPRRAGSKMLVFPDGTISDTIGGGEMERRVVAEALGALRDGRSRLVEYSLVDLDKGDAGVCGGNMTVYVEPVVPRPTLVVIGAGHVGRAVAKLAHWLGFRLVVSDDRPEYCTKQYLPDADLLLHGPYSELPRKLEVDRQTYIVMTTKDVRDDLSCLPGLLETQAAYIGVIGSRRRWATTRGLLAEAGVSAEKLERVASPIGLELDAETPEEIAVSILAEIIMLRRGGHGQRMSDYSKSRSNGEEQDRDYNAATDKTDAGSSSD
jgi:xanthine dehydrogenase accessory factor